MYVASKKRKIHFYFLQKKEKEKSFSYCCFGLWEFLNEEMKMDTLSVNEIKSLFFVFFIFLPVHNLIANYEEKNLLSSQSVIFLAFSISIKRC